MLVCVYYRITGIPLLATLCLFASFFPFQNPLVHPPYVNELQQPNFTSIKEYQPQLKKPTKLAGTKYLVFCDQCKQQAIPTSEDTLVLFVTHLANQQLSHATIQVYISVVRYLHIVNKEYHTFTACVTPRPGQVLKGIRKTHALTHSPKERQPITFPIMEQIHSLLSSHVDNYYNLMIWATCCTAYFGLLRVSKFIASFCIHRNLLTDLLLSDITIDSHVAPQVIRITAPQVIRTTLKQLKTNQYRQGTHIYFGRTSHPVCPVMALIHYLDRHGGRPGPLFMLSNNQLLTRATFSAAINEIFQKFNMHPQNFNTHSFRISATTSAKQAGISDSHIKALGGWKSNAYLKYVCVSPQDLS